MQTSFHGSEQYKGTKNLFIGKKSHAIMPAEGMMQAFHAGIAEKDFGFFLFAPLLGALSGILLNFAIWLI